MNATRRCASARKAKSTNARCEDIPEPHLNQGIAQQQRLADPKVQQVTESEIYAHTPPRPQVPCLIWAYRHSGPYKGQEHPDTSAGSLQQPSPYLGGSSRDGDGETLRTVGLGGP